MSDKKLAGLWIDGTQALVAKNHDGSCAGDFFLCDPVKLEVQHGNSSQNAGNNAEITNRNKYFKEIEKLITNTEDLFITGPGQWQEELKHHLHDTAQYKNLKITLGTAQHMSGDQVLNVVKQHFGK